VRAEYGPRIKAEHDVVRQDALYREANEAFRRIKDGFVSFDGHKTGWDASSIAEEFRHGTDETMLVVDDARARDLYFFIHGRLWKWYRELKSSPARGSFDDVAELLQDQFGKTREQATPRSQGGPAYRSLTWSDDKTRVTALFRGAETCLVFEDGRTLEHLAMLREHALPRADEARSGVLDSVIMSANEREAWRAR